MVLSVFPCGAGHWYIFFEDGSIQVFVHSFLVWFCLNCIYLSLTVLGLHCCMRAFSSRRQRGLLSRCTGWPSHCGGPRLLPSRGFSPLGPQNLCCMRLLVGVLSFQGADSLLAAYVGSIPGLGSSLGEGKGYPRQCSGLENSMDCIVHGVAESPA